MVYFGSSGDTQGFLEKSFGFHDQHVDSGIEEYKLSQSSGFKLLIANSAWFRDQSEIKESYFDQLKKQNVEHFPLKLAALNAWVKRATEGKITHLLDQLSPLVKSVFVNAIYFKADWASPFKPQDTHSENFESSDGKKKIVKMMHQTSHFDYAETDLGQVLVMPYLNPPFEMMFILPKERFGLSSTDSSLSSDTFSGIEKSLTRAKVTVSIPKFKFETSQPLSELLKKTGYGALFEKGDYSKLFKTSLGSIGDIIQATTIAVDERGTEASAASAVALMGATFVRAPEKIKIFKADQPFFFLLKNKKSGAIYFMGRVSEP